MIKILLSSFLIVFFYTPFGIFFERLKNNSSFSLQLLYATIVLSFIALTLNFLTPLNKLVSTIVLIFSLIILYKNKELYFSRKYLKFCLISSIIIFLYIACSNVYRPDAGLYHLPYIDILNNEKIIFGLSNIHFRFAHTSIIQYLSAISNNYLIGTNGIVYPAALIGTLSIIYYCSEINKNIKIKKFSFLTFFNFFILVYILYKLNRYSEFGNDGPSHLLFFILVSEIIKNLKSYSPDKISKYFLLSIFIFMNKIILILSIIFPFIFLIKKFSLSFLNKKFLFCILFLSLWTIKNLIISGCILYPLKNSCIKNLPWVDLAKAEKVSIENEAWAKGWPDFRKNNKNITQNEYNKKFLWVETWLKNHFINIVKILSPYFIFLNLIIIILFKNFKKYEITNLKIFLISLSLLGTTMWFYKVPTYRYGYSYIIIFFALFYSLLIKNIELNNKVSKLIKSTLTVLLMIFIFKNLYRIVSHDNNYNNYPWPKYYSYEKNNNRNNIKYKIINQKKIFYSENDYCMYGNSPCGISFENLNIKQYKNYYFFELLKS